MSEERPLPPTPRSRQKSRAGEAGLLTKCPPWTVPRCLEGRASEQGFATILTAPHHKPYDRFIPAPGHGLGFNDLKVIECRELIAAIAGRPSHTVDFNHGLRIEKSVHAMAQSFREGQWVEIDAA